MQQAKTSRIAVTALLLVQWAPALCGIAVGADSAASPPIQRIRVRDGFIVECVAAPPLVERPMLASFDDRGHLYVADSAGVNLRGNELVKNPPHSIRVLDDTDGDGHFDKSIVYADRLVFPQGILWHDGSVYVSSPPSFWRLRDTDADGVADERDELVTGFANTGVADDMHGASLGPDGRIYWCAGRFPHEIRRPGGPLIHKGTAPLILRCRPDGSDVEVVCGAPGNAVGVAFTPEGEPLASGTFLAPDSMGAGLRDALIHCVDGGEYPVRDRVLNEHQRTGELLPPLAHLGVAAASDLTIYRGDAFGEDFDGSLFTALFNMHKVVRHALAREGATFTCHPEDFLVSDEPDFHPTDVLEDADGSLLVIDTGGWFRIGCPTSQIAKPDVKGAIYRVRRAASAAVADPRGLSLEWVGALPSALVTRLEDSRHEVRDRAIAELARRGETAVEVLADAADRGATPQLRRNAVWALTRIDGSAARAAVREVLNDSDASVRQGAVRSVGLHRDQAALVPLTTLVTSDTPPIRREAATSLGRIGSAAAVPALLEGLSVPSDRFLEHALIFALIQIAEPAATRLGLADARSSVRRGALIALDQMDGANLTSDEAIRCVDPAEPALEQAALWVIGHHGDWAPSVRQVFAEWLVRDTADATRREQLKHELWAFCHDESIQRLVAQTLSDEQSALPTRLWLLEVVAQAPISSLPQCWAIALRQCLGSGDAQLVRQSVATARTAPPAPREAADNDAMDLKEALVRVAQNEKMHADVRVDALAAVAPRLERLEPSLFEFLASRLNHDELPLVRLKAAEALGQTPLDETQLQALAAAVAEAGVLELPPLLLAYKNQPSEQVARQLLAALETSPGLANVSPPVLRATFEQQPSELRERAERLIGRFAVTDQLRQARLVHLQSVLAGGEIQRGRDVFFGNKSACATCHAVQATGGRIGPDLSKIGAIRAGGDLLEAIVFPSASFARGYEPYVLTTHEGMVHAGIIGRETADAIHIYNSTRAETRVPRSSIDEFQPSTVSIMPEGMDTQLTRQELADLLAFLGSLK